MNQSQPLPPSATTADEDRILRTWTPLILRTVLIASTIVLVAGLIATVMHAPGFYVNRFHALQHGRLHDTESVGSLVNDLRAGDPHAILTMGLYLLTLVPLVRVAFTLVLFLKDHDYIYVASTTYVLGGLILGVILGRIG